jgi:Protein of unknown function (DUF1353)
MLRRLLLTLSLSLILTSCARYHYEHIKAGTLTGRVIIEWMEPDLFLFRPDEKRPLTFIRANGDKIQPGRMLTDGGSIPRPVQALKNYSPWGYGPAFVIHDWLFFMQYCRLSGWEKYTLDDAADIMSEVMKTMMESPKFNYGDATTVYTMYEAVRSPWAQTAWKSRKCPALPSEDSDSWRPTARFVIDYDQ